MREHGVYIQPLISSAEDKHRKQVRWRYEHSPRLHQHEKGHLRGVLFALCGVSRGRTLGSVRAQGVNEMLQRVSVAEEHGVYIQPLISSAEDGYGSKDNGDNNIPLASTM